MCVCGPFRDAVPAILCTIILSSAYFLWVVRDGKDLTFASQDF